MSTKHLQLDQTFVQTWRTASLSKRKPSGVMTGILAGWRVKLQQSKNKVGLILKLWRNFDITETCNGIFCKTLPFGPKTRLLLILFLFMVRVDGSSSWIASVSCHFTIKMIYLWKSGFVLKIKRFASNWSKFSSGASVENLDSNENMKNVWRFWR